MPEMRGILPEQTKHTIGAFFCDQYYENTENMTVLFDYYKSSLDIHHNHVKKSIFFLLHHMKKWI